MTASSGPLANHPRLVDKNPLAEALAEGANPRTVIPDGAVIVRGGRGYQHQPGNVISTQMGSIAAEAASGLPHGTIRIATAGQIRAAGGVVELLPEAAWEGGPVNTWHVEITEGPRPSFPEQGVPNPVPKEQRLIPPRSS